MLTLTKEIETEKGIGREEDGLGRATGKIGNIDVLWWKRGGKK